MFTMIAYIPVPKKMPSFKKYSTVARNLLQASGSRDNISISPKILTRFTLLTSASCLFVFIGQHLAGKPRDVLIELAPGLS